MRVLFAGWHWFVRGKLFAVRKEGYYQSCSTESGGGSRDVRQEEVAVLWSEGKVDAVVAGACRLWSGREISRFRFGQVLASGPTRCAIANFIGGTAHGFHFFKRFPVGNNEVAFIKYRQGEWRVLTEGDHLLCLGDDVEPVKVPIQTNGILRIEGKIHWRDIVRSPDVGRMIHWVHVDQEFRAVISIGGALEELEGAGPHAFLRALAPKNIDLVDMRKRELRFVNLRCLVAGGEVLQMSCAIIFRVEEAVKFVEAHPAGRRDVELACRSQLDLFVGGLSAHTLVSEGEQLKEQLRKILSGWVQQLGIPGAKTLEVRPTWARLLGKPQAEECSFNACED
ncbi:MAG: hypothetical protein HC888_04185 [Candidatus Competibacteraceae bacterium]|nr:hypothetical protein [Candidatus Competibacteraceae bacterium]